MTALIALQRSGDPEQHRPLAAANCCRSVSPQRMIPIFGMLCLVTFTFTPWLPTVTSFSTACSIFISRHYAEKDITVTRSPFRLSMSPVDGGTNNDGTDDFSTMMASLQSRVQEIQDKETKIPLVVLDSMLPRQVLRVQVRNALMMDLVRDCLQREHPFFGMLGMARLRSGQQIHLTQGVEVEILKDELEFLQNDGGQGEKEGGVKLALRAGRRFQIEGEIENAGGGWTEARVTFLDSEQEERTEIENGKDPTVVARAISRARELTSPNMNMPNNLSLVDRWIELAKENERQEGQIDKLLKDLGTIPPPEQPSERAFWVGALINPLPAMGVAMEVRPALLTAETAEQRVEAALEGIFRSIKHMDGSARLW
ncbi:ATP-dependent protease La LON substrate-binding domain containing protein [Nitzschia inconspicua]|uniref:ATP-dependent protease La LON substrate-binding domain containing protein n=1 Tax=Nitzschia inconspicua TaxID=303405 RepID=A0A9K3KR63_9STRA|nr:ATP-dependent protease La LON substrate-binding domain containing protein [Nitzschia inconspicua]